MGVPVPDTGQELGPDGLRSSHSVKKAGDKAHMAQPQHKVPARQRQALNRQRHRLGRDGAVHRADALQAHLADLPEGVALLAGAVDILGVVVAPAAALLHLGVLGDGEGHVGLQRQQPPVQVREGNDLVTGKKPAVLLVQSVLLKPAHVVLPEARAFKQQPRLEGDPFLGAEHIQIQFHWGVPPWGRGAPARLIGSIVLHYISKVKQ